MKSNKKTLIAALSMAAVICVGFTLAWFGITAHAATAEELFGERSGVTLDADYSYNDVSSVLMTGSRSDGEALLLSDVCGEFSFTYAAVNLNSVFELEFKDESGLTFVVTTALSDGKINSFVEYEGEKYGLYYSSSRLDGETLSRNQVGVYTLVNKTLYNTISFDPKTMTFTTSDSKGNAFDIWNFGSNLNDGIKTDFDFVSMVNYDVTLRFAKADDALVIKSLCGQNITETIFNGAAPALYILEGSSPVKGSKYYLPEPYAFDVIDGRISDVNVTVVDTVTGKTVLNEIYTENSAIDVNASQYLITYTAEDSGGKKTALEFIYNSLESAEVPEMVFNGSIASESWGKGSVVSLPFAYIPSTSTNAKLPCKLTVLKDGAVLDGYDRIVIGGKTSLTLSDAGEYVVRYESADRNIVASAEYILTSVTDKYAISEVSFDKVYLQDSVLNIPAASFTTAANESYAADMTVKLPDGSETTDKNIILEQLGVYFVEYSLDLSGIKQSYSFSFVVNEPLVDADGNIWVYGTSPVNPEEEGLIVQLKPNSTFTYNKIIDLSDNTSSDILIDLYCLPAVKGNADFTSLTVTLTDIHDPSNYVIYHAANSSETTRMSYIRGTYGANTYVGLENNKNLHIGKTWGNLFYFSFYGDESLGAQSVATLRYYLDYESKQMLVVNPVRTAYPLICDLDDPAHFPSPWEGFTTGEVLLTVSAGDFNSSEGYIFIRNIDGEKLSFTSIDRVEQPSLVVDTLGYDESELPYAVVDRAYNLFSAKAIDSMGTSIGVVKEVWLNYGSENAVQLEVSNGSFVPTSAGKYTIVYKATDAYLNESVVTLQVEAVESLAELSASLIGTLVHTGYVYEPIELPVLEAVGGSGTPVITLELYQGSSFIKTIDNYTVVVERKGNYTVKYKAVDYIGNTVTKEISISVGYLGKPQFTSVDSTLGEYLLTNIAYPLPAVNAVYYSSEYPNGISATVTAYLTDANGAEQPISGDTFTPVVTNSGDKITLRFEAVFGTQTSETELSFTGINNINDGYIDLTQYFVSDNASVQKENTETGVVLRTAEDATEFTFIKTLLANTLNLHLGIESGYSELEGIDIYITDSINSSESIVFSLRKASGGTDFGLNGLLSYFSSYILASNDNAMITYDASNHSILLNGTNVPIKTYADGSPFDGFGSGRVNVKFRMVGVTGESAIRIFKINNQPFNSYSNVDIIVPEMVLANEYERIVALNQKISIQDAIASDVLGEIASISLKVVSKGVYLESTTGVVFEDITDFSGLDFICSEYASYTLTYTIKDTNGRKTQKVFTVQCIDSEKPTVKVNGSYSDTAKAGSTLTIHSATATDNMEGVNLAVVMITPTGIYESVTLKDDGLSADTAQYSYTFDTCGRYALLYMATDASGNLTVITYYINVA